MFIAYDIKNGVEYAKLCISKRDGSHTYKEYINLGRVLDKKRNIFQNRSRGVFTYSVETQEFGTAPVDFIPQIPSRKKKQLILDFGDVFFIDSFLQTAGLKTVIDAVSYGNPDTLYAMLSYYILCSMANCHAGDWWEGSYASILYPNASLSSQRISDFLTAIGDEYSQREFFHAYFRLLERTGENPDHILIDSTGLPNSIHFPLTAISNHNGEINNEVRLIYMVQQRTGLPIYFRYCPGNVIDASTLVRCLAELKEQGINTKFAILDAGYCTDENIDAFYGNKISFVTRLKENRILYKELVSKHLSTMEARENLVDYNGRYVYIKAVPCNLNGHHAYAYIGLDIERKSSETHKTFQRAASRKMNIDQVYDTIHRQGVFILISSRRIATDKILPLYYTRQQIEQVFDVGKNYADMIPLRVQKEETFRGHLLLTFMATVIIKKIQDQLKKTAYTPESMFLNLRNQKCKVYTDKVITQEAFKKANDCYKLFKIDCPVTIPHRH